MTAHSEGSGPLAQKRRFAAKNQKLGWGIALGLVGIGVVGFNSLMVLAAFLPSDTPQEAGTTAGVVVFFVLWILMGLGLIGWGLYLARGVPLSPEAAAAARQAKEARRQEQLAQRQAAEAERQAAIAQGKATELSQAASALAAAVGAGAALVAYRGLESTAKRLYPQEAASKFEEALADIDFDKAKVSSPRFGSIASTGGKHLEIFRDFVVFGQEAHDVDATTRGQVYSDGAIQVTQRVVLDNRNRSKVVSDRHDLRTAHVSITSASWALNAEIHPDSVPGSRQYIDQLAAHVETLKPQGVSASDIRDMVDAILNNSGQPPAEKLRQLSNLRYERLLTETEFAKAKTKILGI